VETELARVLNVLAHEIRTPLAVSQGYLKLMAEGRLTAAAEQESAIDRTRKALGKIAALCGEMGRLAALADADPAELHGRMPARTLVEGLYTAQSNHTPARRGVAIPDRDIATDGGQSLPDALAALGSMAFGDAGPGPTVVDVVAASDTSLTVIMGEEQAAAACPRSPDEPTAAALSLVRGGFGLSLLWAARVLDRHRVRAWQQADAPGAIGVVFPLVNP